MVSHPLKSSASLPFSMKNILYLYKDNIVKHLHRCVQTQTLIAINDPDTARIWHHLTIAAFNIVSKNSCIAFPSFALGNGSSGTGQFNILQSGSQPSLTWKKKSLSGGTTLRI